MTEATPLAHEQITHDSKRAPARAGRQRGQSHHGRDDTARSGRRGMTTISTALVRLRTFAEGGSFVWRDAAQNTDFNQLRADLRAALSASPAPSGQGVSGEVERLSVAMLTARAAFERIRVALINELDEPVRRAFWAAVAARDALDNAMPILAAPAPSCAPGEVERAFRPMETWEERDEAVLLLIDYDDGDHPLDDARFAITIGHNNDHNVGDDEGQGWRFAGWCWSHDHYVEGKGKPVGWMPIPHILARAYASFDGELAALSPQGLDAKEGGE